MVKLRGKPPHGYIHSSNQTTILRVRTVYIVKRNGQQQEMLLDKITSRIKKLCYGLDKKYVDPAAITLKVRLSGDHHVVKFVVKLLLRRLYVCTCLWSSQLPQLDLSWVIICRYVSYAAFLCSAWAFRDSVESHIRYPPSYVLLTAGRSGCVPWDQDH
jgi:hypothetical protein